MVKNAMFEGKKEEKDAFYDNSIYHYRKSLRSLKLTDIGIPAAIGGSRTRKERSKPVDTSNHKVCIGVQFPAGHPRYSEEKGEQGKQ